MPDTKFIAEVSSNHNRDLNRALKFVDAAAELGCDAVKFQLFKIDQLFAPEILERSADHRARKKWELPLEFLPELSERAHKKGIEFSCTPFYLDAVQELERYVDFYKVASYELLWHDLLKACAGTGKPLILSTGMSNENEVHAAINALAGLPTSEITILRCTSAYPTPVEEANISSLKTLRRSLDSFQKDLDLSFGWSDHTLSAGVIARAVFEYQAQVVEFHLDLEGEGHEYASKHCWLPRDIEPVIQMIRDGHAAAGDGRLAPTASEEPDREWRADPRDGLRPLRYIRGGFNG